LTRCGAHALNIDDALSGKIVFFLCRPRTPPDRVLSPRTKHPPLNPKPQTRTPIPQVLLAASSVQNGIGIIKLGSGSMCLHAVLASGSADVCLLKAVPFDPRVVFEYVAKVVQRKGYCIIVVEDGAGDDHVKR
jgi:hypothetical protein